MVKLQESVKFIDDMGESFTGTAVGVNSNQTLDIKVKRKIGFESQVFMHVPKEIKDQKNKPKPRYTELSPKNVTPKKNKDTKTTEGTPDRKKK